MFKRLAVSGLALTLGFGCEGISNKEDFLAKVPLSAVVEYVINGDGEPRSVNGRVHGVDLQVSVVGNPNKVKNVVLYTRDKEGNIEFDRELAHDGCCVKSTQDIESQEGVTYIKWKIHSPENKQHLVYVEDWEGYVCDDCPKPNKRGIASEKLRKEIHRIYNEMYRNH